MYRDLDEVTNQRPCQRDEPRPRVHCLFVVQFPSLAAELCVPLCLQDMLPMAGDPSQGAANYNIEDFADLGMFPPFSE